MTDLDESDQPATKTWTTAYRLPIGIVSGLLAALCCLLITGGSEQPWIGAIGLAILIAWVVVYQVLHRRGY